MPRIEQSTPKDSAGSELVSFPPGNQMEAGGSIPSFGLGDLRLQLVTWEDPSIDVIAVLLHFCWTKPSLA